MRTEAETGATRSWGRRGAGGLSRELTRAEACLMWEGLFCPMTSPEHRVHGEGSPALGKPGSGVPSADVREAHPWEPQLLPWAASSQQQADRGFARGRALISHAPQASGCCLRRPDGETEAPRRWSRLPQVAQWNPERWDSGPRSSWLNSGLKINAYEVRRVEVAAGTRGPGPWAPSLLLGWRPETGLLITSQASSCVVATLRTPGVGG